MQTLCIFMYIGACYFYFRESRLCWPSLYEMVHLVWKIHHFILKSQTALQALGEEFGLSMCIPSGVNGTQCVLSRYGNGRLHSISFPIQATKVTYITKMFPFIGSLKCCDSSRYGNDIP